MTTALRSAIDSSLHKFEWFSPHQSFAQVSIVSAEDLRRCVVINGIDIHVPLPLFLSLILYLDGSLFYKVLSRFSLNIEHHFRMYYLSIFWRDWLLFVDRIICRRRYCLNYYFWYATCIIMVPEWFLVAPLSLNLLPLNTRYPNYL